MAALTGRTVVLGITGGIAAYKAAELVRALRREGAEVRVVMTRAATNFITPLTLRELSRNPVAMEMFAEPAPWYTEHISLARAADLFLIAPATANCLGKLAAGIADDLLTTTALATAAPILLAPAMNAQMWANPVVQENVQRLAARGVEFVEPETGPLACGEEGQGRLAAVETILARVVAILTRSEGALAGARILVTAGGTREPLDPVRFLGNRSSGRMGYALATAARAQGARVTLIHGPVALPDPPGIETIAVETATEMAAAVDALYPEIDIVLMAAAVADYRPREVRAEKMKKDAATLTLELVRNPDILADLGKKKEGRILVGFAAETGDPVAAAQEKLIRKNLDLVVANDVTEPGAGFDVATNRVHLVSAGGVETLPLLAKEKVAATIIDRVAALWAERGKQAELRECQRKEQVMRR